MFIVAANPAALLTTVPDVPTVHPLASSIDKTYNPADTPERSSVISPLSQLYNKGKTPPVEDTSIEPFPSPQFSSTTAVDVIAKPLVLLPTVYESEKEHPPAPVKVSEYVPAVNPDISSVIAPLLQANEYGLTPPEKEMSIDPEAFPHISSEILTEPTVIPSP